jgi:hypothetical protein
MDSISSRPAMNSHRVSSTARLAALLLALVGALGCSQQIDGRNTNNRASREESVELARTFVTASVSGDSTVLARIARDKVIRTVLVNHRMGSMEHLRAAAKTFRSPKASVYTSGSDVRFHYILEGKEFSGFVALVTSGERLVVDNYGIPAIID